jgi:hypothetical protein
VVSDEYFSKKNHSRGRLKTVPENARKNFVRPERVQLRVLAYVDPNGMTLRERRWLDLDSFSDG